MKSDKNILKKRSENEKIRKGLLSFFNDCYEEGDTKFEGMAIKDIVAWLEKQKEFVADDNKTLDKDEKIRKKLIEIIGYFRSRGIDQNLCEEFLAYLEKQKEQKPTDDKAFEEWINDWWKHNKVNNPDSYDKGDEIQFDEKGFKNFCRYSCPFKR